MQSTLIEAIAVTGDAIRNCERTGNTNWLNKHKERLALLARDYLPSGSGIDNGCTIESADFDRVVIRTAFHHMNEHGMYDGWSEHKITVRANISGLVLTIGGRDRNAIKEHLHEVFYSALTEKRDSSLWFG
jgi:hypothetical protein